VEVISQGEIVAEKLEDYLVRHPRMENRCSRGGRVEYLTTESAAGFDAMAAVFMGEQVHSRHVRLGVY
jgi:glutamate racemase